MAFERKQQRLGRHGIDQLQRNQILAPRLPLELSLVVAIENDSIHRLIGRPRLGADDYSVDLRARTKLRRTACESLIGCCISARQPGISRGLIGVRAERSAEEAACAHAAVSDEAVLCLSIFL